MLTIIILKHSIKITSNNYNWILPTQLDWKERKTTESLEENVLFNVYPVELRTKNSLADSDSGRKVRGWEGGGVILMINISIMSVSQSDVRAGLPAANCEL